MKSIIFSFRFLILVMIIHFNSCNKEEKIKIPTVQTLIITDITDSSASTGGIISDDVGMTIISRGVCWSTGIQPTISDSKTIDGAGAGSFSSNITGLSGGTIYSVKAYATNSSGTGYGIAMSFKTLGKTPVATTQIATNVLPYTATLNGTVNANYLSTIVTFEYGLSTSYGQIAPASQSPVTGSTNDSVSVNITGLSLNTTYHFRVKSENTLGITYGSDMSFTTLGQIPSTVTLTATNIEFNKATINGSVNPNYFSTTVTFEWGTSTSYGNTITAAQSPLTGTINRNVSANITGLSIGTIYHFRVKSENTLGITYGGDMSFTTNNDPSVTDIDGNGYNTIIIGTQVWMKENLKVTKYNDGSEIPNLKNYVEWNASTTGAYCWYNNDVVNKYNYGALYNWYSIVDSRKLCPPGWHVPSDDEWKTLEMYLGMTQAEADSWGYRGIGIGAQMKTTNGWLEINGNNNSGFSALPGGYCYSLDNIFYYLGFGGLWWSATELSTTEAILRTIQGWTSKIQRDHLKKSFGFSIRCLKD